MIFITNILCCLLIYSAVSNAAFTHQPAATTYASIEEEAYLDWRVESFDTVSLVTWKHTFKGFERNIISLLNSDGNVSISIPDEYKGRAIYNKTGLWIRNLTLADEGTIKITVLLKDLNSFTGVTYLFIIVKPNFTAPLQPEYTVVETNIVTLSCNAEGKPTPTITWFKPNGDVIHNGGRYKIQYNNISSVVAVISSVFSISHAIRLDAGVYKCVANSTDGTAETSTSLVVKYSATITSFPSPKLATIEHATNVPIVCQVHGNPAPQVKWYKNKRFLNGSQEGYTIINNLITTNKESKLTSVLKIKIIKMASFGNYTCEASNDVPGLGIKKTQDTTVLVVSHRPYFLTKPDKVKIVKIGTVVLLNCTVQAHPKPNVKWETDVNMDNRFTFYPPKTRADTQEKGIVEALVKIQNVQEKDYGLYQCHADNTNYTLTWNTTLFIEYEPVINTSPPAHLTVAENQLDYLECSLHSFPASTVDWYYAADKSNFRNITDKSVLEKLPSESYENKIRSRVIFPGKIKRADEGRYICRILNPLKNVEKHTDVIVEWPAEFYPSSISGIENIKIGFSASLSCSIESKPEATINWYRNGEKIEATKTNTLSSDLKRTVKESFININSLSPTDNGTYKCIAENIVAGVRMRKERAKIVNVLYAPIQLQTSANYTVNISQALSLSCNTKANPLSVYYNWTKDGSVITDNNRQSVYIISYAKKDNEGTYQCTPSNSEGIGNTIKYFIKVRAEPIFIKPASCKQYRHVIQCKCYGVGFPMPTTTWVKSPNTTFYNQTTLNITIGDGAKGTYICKLENVHGMITSEVKITTFDPALSEWSSWGACNNTCGNGYKFRSRRCHFPPCNSIINEQHNCTSNTKCIPTAAPILDGWHKDWYIIIWTFIVIAVIVVLIICIVGKRRCSKQAIIVPVKREMDSKPPSVQSIPTQRDIYLPEENQLAFVNNAYSPDLAMKPYKIEPVDESFTFSEPEQSKPITTDTIEVEMHFDEEISDNNYAKPIIPEADYDEIPEEQNDSRYYKYAKPVKSDDSFLKLYDQAGPHKPNRLANGEGSFGYHDNKSYGDGIINGLV